MSLKHIYVTGGAGYVGAKLVPRLLSKGYRVSVLDLMIYGDNLLPIHPNLKVIRGDIRDKNVLSESIAGADCIIHLACISNDPSFELNPSLGKSINMDSFEPLVQICIAAGLKRFIYASSSSVYGVKDSLNVTEEMSLEPLTDYSVFKANCEEILLKYSSSHFSTVSVRPATVCGVSTRQRLDVVVNILTNLAYHKGEITVFGGDQLRPNLHIDDMVEAYVKIIEAPSSIVNGQVFNVGFENTSVLDLARKVRGIVNSSVKILRQPSSDNRSYHISSKKIEQSLDFKMKKSIEDAILDLKSAFDKKVFDRPLENEYYFNIKRMKSYRLE